MAWAYSSVATFQAYLLASFVLGLILSAKCLLQMAFPQFRAPRWVEVIAGLAAFVLAFLLSLDAIGNGGVLVTVAPAHRALMTVGLGLTLVAAHVGVSLLHSRPRPLAVQPIVWFAVVMTLAASGWSSHRYNAGILQAEIEKAQFFAGCGELEPLREIVGVTDRGREVRLFRWLPEESTATSDSDAFQDSRANCHGWVFTGGEHLLWRDGVELILEDNGYEHCQTPRPGDLIIYRNAVG